MSTPNRLILQLFGYSTLVVFFAYLGAAFTYCNPIVDRSIYCPKLEEFGQFFSQNIRASLFAGFLSLGGFLLSLKTFIIINMKRDVFESAKYQEAWELQKGIGSIGRKFDPLRELSAVLFAAILTAIVTAVLQITIGLFQTLASSVLCLWAATFSTTLLVKSLFLIRSNLRCMFDHLDD